MHTNSSSSPGPLCHRRGLLSGLATVGAALLAGSSPGRALAEAGPAVVKGRIKQSIAFWCFNLSSEKWSLDRTCEVARQLGCQSVELLDLDQLPVVKKHGLVCAMTNNGMPGIFKTGFNNLRYHEELIERTRKALDACAELGFPNVITFPGYRWRNPDDPSSGEISRGEGADNCVKGLKKIVGYAEKKKVTLCIEHLNSRDGSHPMKGHPGYQGDDLDWLAGIIRRVGSPRLKFLFDVYHVQIMHGDVMRRIEQYKDLLGHIHVAGNPGRGELDDNQEINFPPIMRKLIEVGYTGFVGQEFIPTRKPLESLRQAVRLCDV